MHRITLCHDAGLLTTALDGLRSRSSVRVERAAELLGAAGVERAVESLVVLLGAGRFDVRVAAARALGRIGASEAAPALLRAYDEHTIPANTASMAVLRIGAGSSPALLCSLQSPHLHSVRLATELSGALGLIESVDLITPLLEQPDLRACAARALGRLGLPSSVATLTGRLERELWKADGGDGIDEEFAVAVATALGQIGDRSAIDVLTASLARAHRLSFSAAAALAAMGPRRSVTSVQNRAAGADAPINQYLSARRPVQMVEAPT